MQRQVDPSDTKRAIQASTNLRGCARFRKSYKSLQAHVRACCHCRAVVLQVVLCMYVLTVHELYWVMLAFGGEELGAASHCMYLGAHSTPCRQMQMQSCTYAGTLPYSRLHALTETWRRRAILCLSVSMDLFSDLGVLAYAEGHNLGVLRHDCWRRDSVVC
jgi:hypothetical protein